MQQARSKSFWLFSCCNGLEEILAGCFEAATTGSKVLVVRLLQRARRALLFVGCCNGFDCCNRLEEFLAGCLQLYEDTASSKIKSKKVIEIPTLLKLW
jgi:hypothetical protein